MTLLEDIQRDAVDSSVPITQLLRECQILAARLDSPALQTWVMFELNGYPGDAELPAYRKSFAAQLVAYMSGPFGRAIKNQRVPSTLLPDSIREDYTSWEFRQNVAELQSLIDQSNVSGKSQVYRAVPPEIFAALPEFIVGFGIMELNAVLPTTAIAGLLDQVRSHALALALQLEKEAPDVGTSSQDQTELSPEKVTQIFHTTIMGGNVNWASGPQGTQSIVHIASGDLDGLIDRLADLGVQDDDRNALRQAIDADDRDGDPRPGTRTRDWLGRMALKTGTDVASNAAGGLIAQAVAQALGLGN